MGSSLSRNNRVAAGDAESNNSTTQPPTVVRRSFPVRITRRQPPSSPATTRILCHACQQAFVTQRNSGELITHCPGCGDAFIEVENLEGRFLQGGSARRGHRSRVSVDPSHGWRSRATTDNRLRPAATSVAIDPDELLFNMVFFASQQESREDIDKRAKHRAIIDYVATLVAEKQQPAKKVGRSSPNNEKSSLTTTTTAAAATAPASGGVMLHEEDPSLEVPTAAPSSATPAASSSSIVSPGAAGFTAAAAAVAVEEGTTVLEDEEGEEGAARTPTTRTAAGAEVEAQVAGKVEDFAKEDFEGQQAGSVGDSPLLPPSSFDGNRHHQERRGRGSRDGNEKGGDHEKGEGCLDSEAVGDGGGGDTIAATATTAVASSPVAAIAEVAGRGGGRLGGTTASGDGNGIVCNDGGGGDGGGAGEDECTVPDETKDDNAGGVDHTHHSSRSPAVLGNISSRSNSSSSSSSNNSRDSNNSKNSTKSGSGDVVVLSSRGEEGGVVESGGFVFLEKRKGRQRTLSLEDEFFENSFEDDGGESGFKVGAGEEEGEVGAGEVGAGEEEEESKEQECAVCADLVEWGQECVTLPQCRHTFHAPCILRWLEERTSCPLCRTTVECPAPDSCVAATSEGPSDSSPREEATATITTTPSVLDAHPSPLVAATAVEHNSPRSQPPQVTSGDRNPGALDTNFELADMGLLET